MTSFGLAAGAQTSRFLSELDQELLVRKVVFVPIRDNMNGIYSRAINESAKDWISYDQQWTLIDPQKETEHSVEELEQDPSKVAEALRVSGAEGLVAGRVTKGPMGLSMRVVIFSGKQGFAVSQEQDSNLDLIETKAVAERFQQLFQRAKLKLPYSGLVLSRRAQMITLNLGSTSGIAVGQELTVVQTLKIERHPKYRFVTGTDLVIMGTLRVDKVEENLSFASILTEREPNAIAEGGFIRKERFIYYGVAGGGQRPEADVAFGNSPVEWRPEEEPTLGRVSVMFGMGSYAIANSLTSGPVSARQSLVPSAHLAGELWLSPQWYTGFEIRQYIARMENPLSGSSPDRLNVSTLETGVFAGRNFLLRDTFWGPKFQLDIGYFGMSSFVDNSSPSALSTLRFGGFAFGLGGSFPLGEKKTDPISLGGKMRFHFFNPTVSETPSSGSGRAQINTFSGFFLYRLSPRTALRSEVMLGLYSANMSGSGGDRNPPATSASHQLTTFTIGLDYML